MKLNQQETLQKLQKTQLEILNAVAELCENEGITWFLDSGTVLGAARHGGFIPWDDDIDIGMLREDFNRFLECASKLDGFYVVTSADTDGFGGMFAKVIKKGTAYFTPESIESDFDQGIFIDVFPYDPLYADLEKQKQQLQNARFWQYILYLSQSNDMRVPHKGMLGQIEKSACRIAHPIVKKLFSQASAREHFLDSVPEANEEVIDIYVPLPYELRHRKETLVPPTTLTFEGVEYPVPADWNDYLITKYGDWTIIPAPEDQKTHLPIFIDFGDGDYYDALGLYDHAPASETNEGIN